MQDKPWRNEDLRECEEALPRLKEDDLEKTSKIVQGRSIELIGTPRMAETERSPANSVGSIDGSGKISWKSTSRRTRSRGFGLRLGEGTRAS